MQPSRTATECEVDLVRKTTRLCDRAQTLDTEKPAGVTHARLTLRLTRASPCEDCKPAPNWLERGLEALSTSEMVGGRVEVEYEDPACPTERGLEALSTSEMVGGRVEVEYEDPACPTAVEAFERVFAFNVRRYVEKLGFGVTANMFVPRGVFDRVGGFRPEGPDDLEWGQRATAAGYRWRYRPEVVVAHPARRDWAELTQKWRRLTQMASVAMLEKPNGRVRWFLRSFLILASPLVHWTTVATSSKLETVEQRLGAIGVLFRIRFWRFIEANRLLREYDQRS